MPAIDPADAADEACVAGADHVWAVKGIHLSLVRGAETEEQCGRCETVRYVSARGGRPRLGQQRGR